MARTRKNREPTRGVGLAVCAVALACAAVVSPSGASANGRFPGASQVVVDPGDRQHLVLRSTFGVLDSREGGAGMRWICEESAFFAPVAYDPAVAVGRGGVVIAGLADGLSRGTQGGCEWEKVKGVLEGSYVVDVSFDTQGRALAVTNEPSRRGRFAASDDDGVTWRDTPLPEDFDALTVDAAPGRPSRLYASGRVPFAQFGGMLRSDDGGARWTMTTFDLRGGREAYIAAVDPNDPDRLWVRVTGDGADRLLVSIDSGTTFREVLAAGGPLYGFALSPDGLRLAVSNPVDGLSVASVADHTFSRLAALDARCLAWSKDGLYACASEPAAPYSLGLFRGGAGAVEPRYRLKDTEPLACPPSTRTGTVCPAVWPGIAARLGKDAQSPDASAPTPSASSSASPPRSTPDDPREAGGCAVAPSRSVDALAVAIVVVATLLLGSRVALRSRRLTRPGSRRGRPRRRETPRPLRGRASRRA